MSEDKPNIYPYWVGHASYTDMVQQLTAERDELLEALLDVVNQSCQIRFVAGKCFVHHSFTAAYEDAIALLERLGYAKRDEYDKEWQLIWPEEK